MGDKEWIWKNGDNMEMRQKDVKMKKTRPRTDVFTNPNPKNRKSRRVVAWENRVSSRRHHDVIPAIFATHILQSILLSPLLFSSHSK